MRRPGQWVWTATQGTAGGLDMNARKWEEEDSSCLSLLPSIPLSVIPSHSYPSPPSPMQGLETLSPWKL